MNNLLDSLTSPFTTTKTQQGAAQVVDIAAQGPISPISTLGGLIQIGAGAILTIGGLAFLMYLLLGGFHWITAGGDKGKVEAARGMITQGIIGLAVLASVFAVYGVILRYVGIRNIDVGQGGTTSQTTSYTSGSGGECSDWCTKVDECSQKGGHIVSKPCSFNACGIDVSTGKYDLVSCNL